MNQLKKDWCKLHGISKNNITFQMLMIVDYQQTKKNEKCNKKVKYHTGKSNICDQSTKIEKQ